MYTFVTNPNGKAKSGTLVAIIKGTKASDIKEVLDKIPLVRRKSVKAVASDMAPNMQAALRESFPEAIIVIDKFHVIRLILEALQTERIKYRWRVIENENKRLKLCKEENYSYKLHQYSNGDTERQLLARSTYILYKSPDKWTESQELRASILFKNYPRLRLLYGHAQAFRNIYKIEDLEIARQKFIEWINKSYNLRENTFNTAAGSVETHFNNILNYYKTRMTNAFAESFNAKIKRFRFNLKGVSDQVFFQYRLTNLFA